MLNMLQNYLIITIKVLMRRKFYTFISLFGIAFTLVVLITAFALYENSYRPHRPESRADRFLTITNGRFISAENGWEWNGYLGFKFLNTYARTLPNMEKFSIHSVPSRVVAFSETNKIEIMFKYTDGAFWEIMDFQFVEGGPFTENDNQNKNFLAVINEATRDQYFGSDKVVGKTIEIDSKKYRVIGVVRNIAQYRAFPFADVWVPTNTQNSELYQEKILGNYYGTILAKSPNDFPKIKHALQELLPQVPIERPDQFDTFQTFAHTHTELWAREWGTHQSQWTEDAGLPRIILLAVCLILLFMLLPALNIINLNISRIMERATEIGVRKAFGATSATLTIQFIIENLLITLIGGMLGLIGTWSVLAFINQSNLLPYAQLSLNFNIFLAALILASMFGLLSGVYPAWRMSKAHPALALRGGAR